MWRETRSHTLQEENTFQAVETRREVGAEKYICKQRKEETNCSTNIYRYAPHNDVSVNDGPHIRRWFHKIIIYYTYIFFLWRCDPTRVMASSFLRFLDHTQRRTTVGRTLLGEWSARRRDLYLTTHNTHNRQTSMPPVGFKPTISAGERPQTYALDRAATGTGNIL